MRAAIPRGTVVRAAALAMLVPAAVHAEPLVAVALHGEEASVSRMARGIDGVGAMGVTLKRMALPNRAMEPEVSSGEVEAKVAETRRRYIDADWRRCTGGLTAALAMRMIRERRRELAARVLLWRVACAVGVGDMAAAREDAGRFATLGLEIPSEVEAATPEAEALLSRALEDAARAPSRMVTVTSSPARGRVAVDGRRPTCTTPCEIPLHPGEHILEVRADGMIPAWRAVRGDASAVAFDLAPASPELVASEWTTRYAGQPVIDTPRSLALLWRALLAPRMVVLSAQPSGRGLRLRGVLAIEGVIAARGAREVRPEDLAAQTGSLVRELLVNARVLEPAPPLYRRPAFWVSIALVAAAAAAGTAYLLYEPPVRVEFTF